MALGPRLASEWACVAGLRLGCLFGINAGELYTTTTVAFRCDQCPGVQETTPHSILECPGTHVHVEPVCTWQWWQSAGSALAKASGAMEGCPMQGAWAAMAEAAQRGHLLGSAAIFLLEVEQRLRGNRNSTKALAGALVQALCLGRGFSRRDLGPVRPSMGWWPASW